MRVVVKKLREVLNMDLGTYVGGWFTSVQAIQLLKTV